MKKCFSFDFLSTPITIFDWIFLIPYFLTGDEKRTPVPTSEIDEDLESVPSELQPSVRLYDIVSDPTESYDVADYFPNVVDEMLGKIAAYNYTAVPVSWKEFDPNCDPAKNGGVWGPWM